MTPLLWQKGKKVIKDPFDEGERGRLKKLA